MIINNTDKERTEGTSQGSQLNDIRGHRLVSQGHRVGGQNFDEACCRCRQHICLLQGQIPQRRRAWTIDAQNEWLIVSTQVAKTASERPWVKSDIQTGIKHSFIDMAKILHWRADEGVPSPRSTTIDGSAGDVMGAFERREETSQSSFLACRQALLLIGGCCLSSIPDPALSTRYLLRLTDMLESLFPLQGCPLFPSISLTVEHSTKAAS